MNETTELEWLTSNKGNPTTTIDDLRLTVFKDKRSDGYKWVISSIVHDEDDPIFGKNVYDTKPEAQTSAVKHARLM